MSTFVCALITLPPELIAYVLSPAGALDRVYPTPANAIVFQGYGLLTFHGPSPPRPPSGVLPLQASLASSVDLLFFWPPPPTPGSGPAVLPFFPFFLNKPASNAERLQACFLLPRIEFCIFQLPQSKPCIFPLPHLYSASNICHRLNTAR